MLALNGCRIVCIRPIKTALQPSTTGCEVQIGTLLHFVRFDMAPETTRLARCCLFWLDINPDTRENGPGSLV